MKITIIGGAGARVPLVTHGIVRYYPELPVSELCLWDIDAERQETMARICTAMASRFGAGLKVSTAGSAEEALEGARFVISSIRVGGLQGRVQDETIALKHGTVGQETIGAGGLALSLRTIPILLDYARQVRRLAPGAWLLNFTNPVGTVHQALYQAGLRDRVIGICDTPREQFEHLAQALDVSLDEAFFDYLGLNHLGWIRRVLVNGVDRMKEALESSQRIRKVYRMPFFEEKFLRDLGLFPTEYLYFYYRPDHARRSTQAGGQTRGQLILQFEEQLMKTVASTRDARVIAEAYDDYLARRNASYMAVETGQAVDEHRLARAREELYRQAAGYERIALDVMRAIYNNRPTVMPVDLPNRGAIPELEDEDAVEVPAAIDGNGAHPLAAGRIPGQVRSLLLQVKECERLTAQAALSGSARLAEEAFTAHPLIQSRDLARNLVAAYRQAHRPHLDYLE